MDILQFEQSVREIIKKNKGSVRLDKLKKEHAVKSEADLTVFESSLFELEKMGTILIEDEMVKQLPPNYKAGKIAITTRGNGYLSMNSGRDQKVLKNDLNGSLDNDIVVINELNQVIKIIKRAKKHIVVECVATKNGYGYQSVDNPHLWVNLTNAEAMVPGHRALVKIGEDKINQEEYAGYLIEIIGHINEPDIDIKTIAYSYGISDVFSKEALDELNYIPSIVSSHEFCDRVDLRNHLIFSLDGDDTKDIDDAISLEINQQGNYLLGVHIADVNHYVRRGSALFAEAADRATSVYLADSVIPMLPPKLSNGICSLNPNVPRLTMSCVMEIDPSGNVIDYNIFESVIQSKKQMTYHEVNQVLNGHMIEGYEMFRDNLLEMQKLSRLLNNKKQDRGYINFALREAKLVVDSQGSISEIIPRPYDKAEIIIENFMIMANETVATHVYWMNLPFPYRIHEMPDQERIEAVIDFIAKLGYKTKYQGNLISSRTIQKLLHDLSNTEAFPVISTLLLRGMQKARYDINNTGHFGLALEHYTHFTSPIRRYPDLMVHELLKKYIKMELDNLDFELIEETLKHDCHHSSLKERQAMEAEEDVQMMKMAEYMQEHIGEEYEGLITNVSSQMMFVMLDNQITGAINLADMQDDYYYFVPDNYRLIGKNTKRTFRIGDRVRVKVLSANKQQKTINFTVIDKLNSKVRVR